MMEVEKGNNLKKNDILSTHSEPRGVECLNCDEFRRGNNFCRYAGWVLILDRDIQTENKATPGEGTIPTSPPNLP